MKESGSFIKKTVIILSALPAIILLLIYGFFSYENIYYNYIYKSGIDFNKIKEMPDNTVLGFKELTDFNWDMVCIVNSYSIDNVFLGDTNDNSLKNYSAVIDDKKIKTMVGDLDDMRITESSYAFIFINKKEQKVRVTHDIVYLNYDKNYRSFCYNNDLRIEKTISGKISKITILSDAEVKQQDFIKYYGF